RIYMPDDITGKPDDECKKYEDRLQACQDEIDGVNNQIKELFETNKQEFYVAYNRMKRYAVNFDIRKYAACTKESGVSYYIICGWMDEEQADKLKAMLDKYEKDTVCIIDDKHETVDAMPPTKLKNPRLFKPFEMYIKMYGLPAYNEIDPTIFVALTYAFIFGAMFGDVGQGLVLFVGGFLLYKLKKISLAAIISAAGFFSTIFGFMFGSVFGFENIINAVWLHPSKAMVNVPFIGKLNTVFIVAIGFGMVLILVTMILNIINAIKSKDKERLLFDTNGIAGLIFYGAVATVLALFMAGKPLPAGMVLLVMFGIPLLLMAFKEPIMHLLEKKKHDAQEHKEGIGMFFVQMFFEMFEVLLSYFSNTLSFVRIGAFAVSHAAMMEVVLMLAGAEHGSTGNLLVIILGNLFVCGLEGLIVGIQVLRLEYYEMFSRFYRGNGREFKPYNTNENTK
ncbi:MAG: ATPase, partial [Lachnospiraceae bacterium]|nr:ATPase [Lachnospiraceae bacterium]